MIDAAIVQTVFTGLVALLSAVGGLVAVRGRKAGVQRSERRAAQRRELAYLGHVFRLECELAEHGHPVPPRPAVLEQDDDADPASAPAALPPPPRPDDSGASRHGQ